MQLQEVTFASLDEMVNEAIETQAFLPLREDQGPFLLCMPDLFAGHPDWHCFTLVGDDGRPVGFIVSLPHKQEGTLSIGPMYIREGCRGQGWGKILVQAFVEWARVRGVRRLFTQTWGGNQASRRVFEGLGFRLVREKPDTRLNGDSTVQYLLGIVGAGS